MNARTEAEIAREGRRVLRKLLPGGRLVRDAQGRYTLVSQGKRTGRMHVDADIVSAFRQRGWLVEDQGAFSLAAAGASWLARAGERFVDQHQVLRTRLVREPDGSERHVVCNIAESPVTWMRHRGAITGMQCEAGEKLRRDFTIARLSPRLGIDWSMPLTGSRARAETLLPDAVLAAKQRFARAMRAVGPDLSDLLYDVCCDLRGLEDSEKARGWPKASACVVLKLALDRLAAHYGMTAVTRARMRAWAMEDGGEDGGGRGQPPPDQNGRQNCEI